MPKPIATIPTDAVVRHINAFMVSADLELEEPSRGDRIVASYRPTPGVQDIRAGFVTVQHAARGLLTVYPGFQEGIPSICAGDYLFRYSDFFEENGLPRDEVRP